MAEKRRVALDISLKENEELHEKLASLEDELNMSRAMLDETKNLVEVLTEMIQETDCNDSGLPNNVDGECSQSLINTTENDSLDETEFDTGDESTIIETVDTNQKNNEN